MNVLSFGDVSGVAIKQGTIVPVKPNGDQNSDPQLHINGVSVPTTGEVMVSL